MTFMQDNAPCHTANVVKVFMQENGIDVLPWPAQSPDMNPIENLWAIVKKRRQKKYGLPKTKAELIEQIFDIWDNIEPELVGKLADSANKRVNKVLKLKGKVSKY
jgi:transposase